MEADVYIVQLNSKQSKLLNAKGIDFEVTKKSKQKSQVGITRDVDEHLKRTFKLASLDKAASGLKKRRRASRSQCPCIRCCEARANCTRSPDNHECIAIGCNKVYTRPAHLKAHLKVHEMEQLTRCKFCQRTLPQGLPCILRLVFFDIFLIFDWQSIYKTIQLHI